MNINRATELALIEQHIRRMGVEQLPARQAYICNDRTPYEDRKLREWKLRGLRKKQMAIALRSRTSRRSR
jgi:hypothetical protein